MKTKKSKVHRASAELDYAFLCLAHLFSLSPFPFRSFFRLFSQLQRESTQARESLIGGDAGSGYVSEVMKGQERKTPLCKTGEDSRDKISPSNRVRHNRRES